MVDEPDISRVVGDYTTIVVYTDGTAGFKMISRTDLPSSLSCLMDIARRLSMVGPMLPEFMEGQFLVRAGNEADEVSSVVFQELPSSSESIVVILSNEGDSVFCIGRPCVLCHMALRTCISLEEIIQGGSSAN